VLPAVRAIRPDAGQVPRLLRFAVLHVPGVDLALRAFDFFISDPLHHYMETGMLTGIKARAEGRYAHVNGHLPTRRPPPWSRRSVRVRAVRPERSVARNASCLRRSTRGEGVIWREQS
jgi:hypothetical protein